MRSIRTDRPCRTIAMRRNVLNDGPGRVTELPGIAATASFVAGGLLVAWSGYVHLHLWQDFGYRNIPTIGPLFLVQSIVGILIGLVVVFVRRVWAAVIGTGFALSTMAGFLISIERGIFGFTDTWSAPFAHEAFVIEVGAIVSLVAGGAICILRPRH